MAIDPKDTRERREEALITLLGQERYGNYYGALGSAWELIQDQSWGGQDPPSTEEELLAALTLIDAVREQVNTAEANLMEKLREPETDRAPAAWERIGASLGMSRQGAERRYLRSQTSGVRDANQARSVMHSRRAAQQDADRRARARWGRSGRADRDWHLDLRVRTANGQEGVARLDGFARATVRLDSMVRLDNEFVSWRDLQALEVIEEVTPWPDVAPPGTLAGLNTEQE